MSSVKRLFVALEPDAAVRDAWGRIQARLRHIPGAAAVRWTRPERLHLTLLFLGDVANERVDELAAALDNACRGKPAFALHAQALGCFPTAKRPDVVWLGFEISPPAALGELQRAVACAGRPFCEKEERREFAAHVTLGRIKPGHVGSRLFGEALHAHVLPREGIAGWRVTNVQLIESELSSQGARYTVLKRYGLTSVFSDGTQPNPLPASHQEQKPVVGGTKVTPADTAASAYTSALLKAKRQAGKKE
jgi:2'-5' RNA ligase